MITRIFGIYILTLFSVSAFAQDIEHDDMYFNSKDREKLRELTAQQYAKADTRKDRRASEFDDELNPTDSYSARNVNPEYSSRSNAETAQADNEDYFVNNYHHQTQRNLSRFNNNFNSWYNSSWYHGNYWGPSIYSWNSPFYGSHYNAWGNLWNDPWYRSSYSSSFSYHWGSNWNYGWGFNNYWNHPGNGWGWGPSYAFGYNSWYGPSWYGGGYPRVIVVNNNNYGENGGRKVVYGKRPVRSSTTEANAYNTRTRSSSYDRNTSGGRTNSGGRSNSGSNEYYNRSWRYTSPANSNANSNSTYSNTRTRSSNYSNDSNSGYQRNSSFGNSNNSYSAPSRSSSPSYNSGGSSGRSSSPAPSGGSNGRSRGSR